MQFGVQLPPEPRSASVARRWVREHLTEIGRADLVPAAEAGVSELVTNGILHAHTTIGLQLSRVRGRVIIEVYDGAPMGRQPTLTRSVAGPAQSTIGRGLRIVGASSREWGVSSTPNGKAVWFQPTAVPGGEEIPEMGELPAAEDDLDDDLPGDVDEMLDSLVGVFPDEAADGLGVAADATIQGDETVEVLLLNAPPWVVHYQRKRWLELIREMQLVALGDPSSNQELARRFCLAVPLVDADRYISEESAQVYERALGDNLPSIDVVFEVPRSMRGAFVEVRDLARDLEHDVDPESLLYLTPGRQARHLREWWLAEVVRQLDGEPPTPWSGGDRVSDDALHTGDASRRAASGVRHSGVDA